MFNSRTLFVIGAGASCDYGFPIGYSLRDEIMGITAYKPGPNEYPSNNVLRYREALKDYAKSSNID